MTDNFRSALPSNRQAGTEGPPDLTTTLFSEAYISGVPLGQQVAPPPPALSQAVDNSTSELNDPNWTSIEGAPPPEVPGGGPSNGRWYYWTGASSLTVQLHNNQSILSVWLPQEPNDVITIQSGQGAAGGIGIYNTTPYTSGEQVASETVAIPSGHPSLTLTSAAAFASPILVLISGEPYPPSKTFLSSVTTATIDPSLSSAQTVSIAITNQVPASNFPLVPAIAGKKIYVISYSIDSFISANTTTSWYFEDYTSGGVFVKALWGGRPSVTPATPPFSFFHWDMALDTGLFATAVGDALTFNYTDAPGCNWQVNLGYVQK